MHFSVHLEQRRHALIVRLAGELDHHSSDAVRTQLEDAIVRGNVQHVILSLKELTFMDSSGIGVILGRYKLIKSRGGRMIVCDIAPPVHRLFDLSGLFKIISVEADESQALSSLGVVS